MTGLRNAVESMRRILVDSNSSTSISDRLRARRFRTLLETFPELAEMRVLDLGGTTSFWASVPMPPAHVVLVNLSDEAVDQPWITSMVGDVCDPSDALRRERFDLVFSNSVIEHVGGHARRAQMADVVRGFSDRHWVQTPYRYFPIEPHWLFPGFQFLPTPAQARVGARWPLTWSGPVSHEQSVADAMGVELLNLTQFRHYFPDSHVSVERVVGFPKSLIAWR